jgi:hypothetical protein
MIDNDRKKESSDSSEILFHLAGGSLEEQVFSHKEQQETGIKKSFDGVACWRWDAVMERDQSTGISQPPLI